MSNEPMVARGGNVSIEVNATEIIVTTIHGLIRKTKDVKVIPTRHIAQIDFRKPSTFLLGHLYILYWSCT